MSGQFRAEFRRVFIPAQVNCWLSPEGARRCSDAFFSKAATNFLHVDNGNANDHSVTISLITQANSVRRLSVDGDDSPRNASSDFHRRSTQALLSDKDDSSLLLDTASGRNTVLASNSHHQMEDDASPLLKPFNNHNHRHMDSSISSTGSSPLPANNNSVLQTKPNGSAHT